MAIKASFFPTAGLWIRQGSFGDLSCFQNKTHVSVLLLLLATLTFNAGLGVIQKSGCPL